MKQGEHDVGNPQIKKNHSTWSHDSLVEIKSFKTLKHFNSSSILK